MLFVTVMNVSSLCPPSALPAARRWLPGKEGDVDMRCPNYRSCPAQLTERIYYAASRGAFDIEALGFEAAKALTAPASLSSLRSRVRRSSLISPPKIYAM